MKHLLAQAAALSGLLDSTDGHLPRVETAEAAWDCAMALLEHGQYPEALRISEALLRAEGELAPAWGPKLALLHSRALFYANEPRRCHEVARAALQRWGDQTGTIVNMLRVSEAAGLWRAGRTSEAIEALTALRFLLLTLPDSQAHAACALYLSSSFVANGQRATGREMALEAWVSAKRCNNVFWQSLANQALAAIERQSCKWGAAEDAAIKSLAGFQELGNLFQSSQTRRNLAITQWKRGKLAEALATLAAGEAEAQEAATQIQRTYNSMLEALIRIHLGDHEQARAILTDVRSSLRPSDDARSKMLVLEYLGDVDLEQGKAEHALPLYREALAQALALVPRGDVVAELRRRIAECHLLMGKSAEAKAEATAALELCREIHERYD